MALHYTSKNDPCKIIVRLGDPDTPEANIVFESSANTPFATVKVTIGTSSVFLNREELRAISALYNPAHRQTP